MLTVDPARAGARRGARLLDLGSGGGRHAYAVLRAGAAVIALDRERKEVGGVVEMVGAMVAAGEIDRPRFGPVVAEAGRLPFGDESFDAVIASEVLEHVHDDCGALVEVARVLRSGGALALSVPRAGPERVNWRLSRAYHDRPGGHVRIYDRRTLERRVRAAGFAVEGREYRHGLHTPYWWLRCVVGVDRDDHPLVAAYHRLLVWEIERNPTVLRAVARVLDPLLGKSLVLYCIKRS